MFEENKAQKVQNNTPTKEVINDIDCEGFLILAKTTVGLFLIGNEKYKTPILPSKENIIISFAPIIEALALEPLITREQWDNIHLIVCHSPVLEEVTKSFFSKEIGNQPVLIHTEFMQSWGILVTEDILKLKAFDLHDDIIAQYNTEKESIAQSGDKDSVLVEESSL